MAPHICKIFIKFIFTITVYCGRCFTSRIVKMNTCLNRVINNMCINNTLKRIVLFISLLVLIGYFRTKAINFVFCGDVSNHYPLLFFSNEYCSLITA